MVDAAHAALQNQVAGLLHRLAWLVAVEVSFNHYGDRDDTIVAFHLARGTILVVEIRTAIGDVQAMLGSIDVQGPPGAAGRSRSWLDRRIDRGTGARRGG